MTKSCGRSNDPSRPAGIAGKFAKAPAIEPLKRIEQATIRSSTFEKAIGK